MSTARIFYSSAKCFRNEPEKGLLFSMFFFTVSKAWTFVNFGQFHHFRKLCSYKKTPGKYI
jgi:hypothetical protein